MTPIATSDYVEVAQRLVGEFRDEQCQLVIALTHMREPNDIRLGWFGLELFQKVYFPFWQKEIQTLY